MGRTLILAAAISALGFASIVAGAQDAPPAAAAPVTVWDGVYTKEQADRGESLYAERCAQCHGDGLQGVEAAPALTGPVFYNTWEGETLAALLDRMRTMPPDKPGSLSRVQTTDVLAHLLRVGDYPAGMAPLDSAAGALARITVRTYKP
jgi:S-disulfanyl-L-cysteine oxidoreductase SoxD